LGSDKSILYMITIDIGTNGRYGNQMFQYAAMIGIATKQGLNYGVDYKKNGDSQTWDKFHTDNTYLQLAVNKPFNLSAPQVDVEYPTINEGGFNFNETLFHTGDNVKLRGYFQTVKYFEHCQDLIRKEFTFKKEITDVSNQFLENKRDHETVSIHVRRCDYLKYTWHGICDIQYYTKAITNHFSDKSYNFIVITDDIAWCKSTFVGNNNFSISESGNQFVDMSIMSMCDHHIIANSTFSWWGSWLNNNPNKKIVAPATWFREHLSKQNTKDLYLSSWIIV